MTFGFVAAGSHLAGRAAGKPQSRQVDARAIARGGKAWGRAYVTGDVDSVRRVVADDSIGVIPRGETYDKASVLNDIRKGPRETSDTVGPRFHDDTAIAQVREPVVAEDLDPDGVM